MNDLSIKILKSIIIKAVILNILFFTMIVSPKYIKLKLLNYHFNPRSRKDALVDIE